MFDVEFYDAHGRLDHNANVASLEELNELACGRTIRIVGERAMSTEEAMGIIRDFGETHRCVGVFETLQMMQRPVTPGLTYHQQHAFDIVFSGFRKLFHGDEA